MTCHHGRLRIFVASGFSLDKCGRAQQRIAAVWARVWCGALAARSLFAGRRTCAMHPVAVYASNHTSYMDTPVIFAALPFQFRILAKKDLWPIAFIGWYLDRSGQIPIDTVNPRATLSSLGVGVKALRSGMPLFVFPEGARTPPANCGRSSPARPTWPFAPRFPWCPSL
jgi:1-acyl-sn-glycerol-3-phosphate acyltransferase